MSDPIEARDDASHEHGGEPGWSERHSFAFFDTASGFGGVARTEFRPADRIAEATVNLFVPEGAVATVLAREQTGIAPPHVGRVAFAREEPMQRWSVRCKDTALIFPSGATGRAGKRTGAAAQVDLDLQFETWGPPAGQASRRTITDDVGFVQVVSSGHFEQAGRFSGRLRVGGRAATVDGVGARVRSWGVRDATARHSERFYAIPFGPTLAFGMRAVTLGERTMQHGWVLRDGALREIRSVHLEITEAGRGVERARIDLIDDDGDRYAIDAETVDAIPLREGGARVVQAMTRFTLEGRETRGLVETLEEAARAIRIPEPSPAPEA